MNAYGTLARFESPAALVAATRAAREAGYRRMDAYTPVPVEGLPEALGRKGTAMPLIVLLGGIAGGTGGFFMQWFAATVDYPFNIGGRPFNSWPMFIPVTFELTVLCAALAGVFGMLALNGLPRLHHPIFKAPGIERATTDGYFLCIEAKDDLWRQEETPRFLYRHGAAEVMEAPA